MASGYWVARLKRAMTGRVWHGRGLSSQHSHTIEFSESLD
jgi:hypothetical protein